MVSVFEVSMTGEYQRGRPARQLGGYIKESGSWGVEDAAGVVIGPLVLHLLFPARGRGGAVTK